MARLSSLQVKRIWQLHIQGFSKSEIAGLVGLGESSVNSAIIRMWKRDGMVPDNEG